MSVGGHSRAGRVLRLLALVVDVVNLLRCGPCLRACEPLALLRTSIAEAQIVNIVNLNTENTARDVLSRW